MDTVDAAAKTMVMFVMFGDGKQQWVSFFLVILISY